MPTQPHTPSDHYAEAERLLAAAESSRTAEMQTADALIALGHAVLATAPRRRSRQRAYRVSSPRPGGSPRERWLHGHDDDTEGGQR
jgi:hypothetical protein